MLLPDRGRLGVLPLPVLLLLLHQSRFSGVLRLTSPTKARTVELAEGRPLRVRGAALCTRLVSDGVLSKESAARVAARAEAHGGTEEKALLALQLMKPRDLWLALRQHERDVLLECFEWPEGEFELTPTDEPLASEWAHDALAVLFEGVASRWSAERTLAALGPAAERFARPGPGFDEARAALSKIPGATALCNRLDGSTRLGEAAGDPRGLAVALLLHGLGGLAYADAPAGGDAVEPAPTSASPERNEIEIVIDAGTQGGPIPEDGAAAEAIDEGASEGSESVDAIRRAVLERHAHGATLDHYALLGVRRTADASEVRRAYVLAAKAYHPDAIARLGLDDLREPANALFGRISRAYEVLSNADLRREYDEGLAGSGEDEAQRIASAETFYRKGDVLLRKGSFDEALRFLRPAAELAPDEAAYRVALGWALFKKQQPDLDAARIHLEHAVAQQPDDAVAHHRLGAVLRALGKSAEAAAHATRAQTLDSRSAKAR